MGSLNLQRGESTGVGIFGLLGVSFVVLKLAGFIDWSWWWVTAPFWGGSALFVAVLLLAGALSLWASWLDKRTRQRYEDQRARRGY